MNAFLYECVFAWTNACFLGRVLFFVDVCVFAWTRVCFLVFLLSFINSQPRDDKGCNWIQNRMNLFTPFLLFSLLVRCCYYMTNLFPDCFLALILTYFHSHSLICLISLDSWVSPANPSVLSHIIITFGFI